MRIVDFYIVLNETPKSMLVEEVGSIEKAEGFLQGHATPKVETRTGKTFRVFKRKDKKDGHEYLVSSFGRQSRYYPKVWDGTPQYFNHCD